MFRQPDLRVLFVTNFSDACFRSLGALSQLADHCSLDLTIVHFTPRGGASMSVCRELKSFLAEADHLGKCRRMVLEGDPFHHIERLTFGERFDLVMAPASDRIGLPRFSSFRGRVLETSVSPMWTAGRDLDKFVFRPNIKTVACYIDLQQRSAPHLRLAVSFALWFGAGLELIHVLSPVHEGTLGSSVISAEPLHPEGAAERIRSLFPDDVPCPSVNVSAGDTGRELRHMLREVEADILFTGPGRSLASGWFGPRLESYVDAAPCPVICVDGASSKFNLWSFESAMRKQTRSTRSEHELRVAL